MTSTMPETHYDLFRALGAAGVGYLVTGQVALTLHGVPRIAETLELLLEPGTRNLEKTRALLASWGFAAQPSPGATLYPSATVTRLEHPTAPIGRIDLVLVPSLDYALLREGSTSFPLFDAAIPAVSREHLLRIKEASDLPHDREDAASIRVLESVLRGETGDPGDRRREQIVKFQRWHTENRCEWLLAALRLQRGLPPEQSAPRDPRFRRVKPWKR